MNGEHVPAGDLGAVRARAVDIISLTRYLGIVEKPRDPHLARAIAPEPPDADAPAAMRDKPLVQKGPPFSRRSSPNAPSGNPITASQVQITAIAVGSQVNRPRASAHRCVNVVASWGRVEPAAALSSLAQRGRGTTRSVVEAARDTFVR